MDQTLITRIIEAALLAANQPLTLAQLSGLFPEDEPAPAGSETPLAPIYVKSLALNTDPSELKLSSEFDDAANDDA